MFPVMPGARRRAESGKARDMLNGLRGATAKIPENELPDVPYPPGGLE
jgi:hypothetical protein